MINKKLNIGIINFFPFAPHIQHSKILAESFSLSGHQVFFLSCNKTLLSCYNTIRRSHLPKNLVCFLCKLGGLQSFGLKNIDYIHQFLNDHREAVPDLHEHGVSTVASTLESELSSDENHPDFQKILSQLGRALEDVYIATQKWVRHYNLDCVVCFNGRIDVTSVALQALKDSHVPFCTHERSWLNRGIYCMPNDKCTSLYKIHPIIQKFSELPLTESQANHAIEIVNQRLKNQSSLESYVYNKNSSKLRWPIESKEKRILVLPSSSYEFFGDNERKCEWGDNIDGLDVAIKHFKWRPDNIILRAHPAWYETSKFKDYSPAHQVYESWCKKSGIYFIPSHSKISTLDLIKQADIIVVNGSSAVIEAGMMGKEIICLSNTNYKCAGFVKAYTRFSDFTDDQREEVLDKDNIRRKTLRYIYSFANRIPVFTDQVIPKSTKNVYIYGQLDGAKIIKSIMDDAIYPSDNCYDTELKAENDVIDCWLKNDQVTKSVPQFSSLSIQKINRIGVSRLLDLRAR